LASPNLLLKLGDIQGNYTCYTHNGASVVDYNMTFFKRFESKAMVKIILPTPIVIYDVIDRIWLEKGRNVLSFCKI
jgi:hypothetical protein